MVCHDCSDDSAVAKTEIPGSDNARYTQQYFGKIKGHLTAVYFVGVVILKLGELARNLQLPVHLLLI